MEEENHQKEERQGNRIAYQEMLPVALEAMMASSTDLSFVKDLSLTYVCASHAFAQMVGIADERELIGKTDYDLFAPAFAKKFREDDKKLIQSGQSLINYIERLPSKNGISRYSSTSKYLLKDAEGNFIGLYGVGRDVTEDKEAFERLKMLTDSIPGGLATYEISPEGVCARYLSEGVYQIAGYGEEDYEQMMGTPLFFVLEEDHPKLQQQIERIKQDGTPIDCDCRITRKDGTCRWVNVKGVLAERQGNHFVVNTVMLDITEAKLSEIKLQQLDQENRCRYEHEQQLRKELVKSSVFYYQLNLTTDQLEEYYSQYQETSEMSKGINTSEQLRTTLLENVYPEDHDKVRNTVFSDALRKAYAEGITSRYCIYRRLTPDGYYHWVKTHISIMEKPDTEEVIAFLHCQDIDHERKAQLAVDTIMSEDMDSVILLNTVTHKANIAHTRHYTGDDSLELKIDFDEVCKNTIAPMIVEEDRKSFLNFFQTDSLAEALNQEKYVIITYQVKEEEELRRKVIKAYYLDECRDEIVVTCRDITELYADEQRQKRELQAAVDAANEANHAKSDFLSHMSHDIRTPLNAVLAFSSREMIAHASEQELREYLTKVNLSGDYLLGIINDVLDMSRIEQNKIILNPQPYYQREFDEIIQNVIGEMSHEKNITFKISHDSLKRKGILVDHVRFNQIFINLLSNAVKFTPQGGTVELLVQEMKSAEAGKVLKRFVVRDNGIGMSPEFLPHAFDSFNQEYRQENAEKVQGTGLGLSIVQKLVKMMGGTIQLESEVNKGTVVTVDLPVALVEMRERAQEKVTTEFSDLKGAQILLAEDNDINVEIAVTLLEKKGCIITCAHNGLEACKLFEQSVAGYYQLILMDIRMPVMNGLEASERIRKMQREDAATVPIIAMTADAFSEDEQEARAAGMNAHITKPVDPQLLYEVCSQYIEK